MSTSEQARRALKAFIRANSAGGAGMLLRVVSVNESENTCLLADDEDSSLEYTGRLRPVIDGNAGVIIYPKLNTWVIAEGMPETADMLIISIGEVSKVKATCATSELEISSAGFSIKKGETLGAILSDLVTQIQAITCNVTAVGAPTGVPINNPAFSAINSRLNAVLL